LDTNEYFNIENPEDKKSNFSFITQKAKSIRKLDVSTNK